MTANPDAATAAASAPSGAMQFAQAVAWPDAECEVHGEGGASAQLVAGSEGVVSFMAVPASPANGPALLSLECADDSGRAETIQVDLAAPSTFRAPPVTRGTARVRPALTGDLASYSDEELWAGGYGRRPDAKAHPELFEAWKRAVTTPAHLAGSKTHSMRGSMGTVTQVQSSNWSGGALAQSSSNATYDFAIYEFTVPVPGRLGAGQCMNAGVWGGLGGIFGTLIQTGIVLTMVNVPPIGQVGAATPFYQFADGSTTAACYANYCAFGFNQISSGDQILGESWSCDSSGTLNASGAFGCFFVEDVQQNESGSVMLAKKGTFIGETADAVIENSSTESQFCGSSGQFFNFGTMKIEMDALRSDSGSGHDYQTDTSLQFNLNNGVHNLASVAVDSPAPDWATFVWQNGS